MAPGFWAALLEPFAGAALVAGAALLLLAFPAEIETCMVLCTC